MLTPGQAFYPGSALPTVWSDNWHRSAPAREGTRWFRWCTWWYIVIWLYGYWVTGLLGYWVTGLLGYWVTGLLGYWVAGLPSFPV